MSETHQLVWAPNAIRDLDEILDYAATTGDPEDAEPLYRKFVPRVDGLTRFPKRARIVPELRRVGMREYRELIVSPYRILFRLAGQSIAILGVFDGRRDLTELLLTRALDPLPFDEP